MSEMMLPVGTIVRVEEPDPHGRPDEGAIYWAKVVGYDMGRTKYHLGVEFLPGQFMEDGGSWAFPSWVTPDVRTEPTP